MLKHISIVHFVMLLHRSETIKVLPLVTFAAHMMGTNSMHLQVIVQSESCALLRICSGGDDQTLSVAHILLDLKSMSVYGGEVVMLLGASGSALKGVSVFDQSLLSVGYDQRLTSWSFPSIDSQCIPLSVVKLLSDFKLGVCSSGEVEVKKVTDLVNNGVLHWDACRMTDVSDVAGIAVSTTHIHARAIVYGQGAQTYDFPRI